MGERMVIIEKLVYTFLLISWVFFILMIITSIGEDKRLKKLNDISTKLTALFFFSGILLIVIRLLILIWR